MPIEIKKDKIIKRKKRNTLITKIIKNNKHPPYIEYNGDPTGGMPPAYL